jgi:LysR family hydrogen peroxide-inducible transcriptional activator
MIVTLKQIQYIVAVFETKSFSKASKLCHVSQSTISQQINQLEEKLGFKLIERSQLPIKFTPEGIRFASKGRRILEKVSELLSPLNTKIDMFG